MDEELTTDETGIDEGPYTWYLIYLPSAVLYLLTTYFLVNSVGIGLILTLILTILIFPLFLTYVNQFYVFYTEEFDPEEVREKR